MKDLLEWARISPAKAQLRLNPIRLPKVGLSSYDCSMGLFLAEESEFDPLLSGDTLAFSLQAVDLIT